MRASLSVSGENGIMAVTGDIGLESVAELKSALLEALGAVESLQVDLSQVTSSHVCTLQLFCSAHSTASRSGKELLLLNISDDIARCIAHSGFCRQDWCHRGSDATCLWRNNGEDVAGP